MAEHIALGSFYYFGKRHYEGALKEFRRAIELQPNNVEALELSAYTYPGQVNGTAFCPK